MNVQCNRNGYSYVICFIFVLKILLRWYKMDVIEVESSACLSDKLASDREETPVNFNNDSVEQTYAYFLPCEESQIWSPREIFPENIAFIDKKKKYCRERKSEALSYPKSLDAEFIKDIHLCEEVFQLSLYQAILYGSSQTHTRFTKGYTELSFHSKINKMAVSEELKKFMSSVSHKCSQMLKDVRLLCDYIELDAEKDFFVLSQGSMINVRTSVNILSLSEQPQPWQTAKSDSEEEPDDVRDYGYLKVSSKSTRANQRGKKSTDKTSNYKIDEDNYRDPSTINVMLSFRNWIPAREIFLKYMVSLANTDHNTYLLVCHIGPLVEIPRITLYQYMMRSQVRKLCIESEEKPSGEERELKMEALGEFNYKDNSDEESDGSMPEIAVVETTDFKFVTEKKEEDAKRKHKKVQIGGHTVCETPVPAPDYVQTIVIPVESDSSAEEDEVKALNLTSVAGEIENLTQERGQIKASRATEKNEDPQKMMNSTEQKLINSLQNDKSEKINTEDANDGPDKDLGFANQSQLLKLSMEEIWKHWSCNEGQYVYAETKLKECLRNYIYDLPPLPRRVNRKKEKK